MASGESDGSRRRKARSSIAIRLSKTSRSFSESPVVGSRAPRTQAFTRISGLRPFQYEPRAVSVCPWTAFRSFCASLGHWEVRGYGPWALEESATGSVIGRAGLHLDHLFFNLPDGWRADVERLNERWGSDH